MYLKYLLLLLPILAAQIQATTILFEDFEDATVTYTTNVADDLTDIANSDYFGRIASDTATPPSNVSYLNKLGTGYFGAQDTDAANSGNVDNIVLSFLGLDILGFTNLSFEGFFAEDTAGDGNEDWDASTSLIVSYQIDGGGFSKLFAIEAESSITNVAPHVDTNFDGDGDGTPISDTFTLFNRSIAGTGSTLDLQIALDKFDAGDEDIAFDNIRISGDYLDSESTKSVPDNHSMLLMPLSLLSLALFRKKKK